jgi:hypothetical protein
MSKNKFGDCVQQNIELNEFTEKEILILEKITQDRHISIDALLLQIVREYVETYEELKRSL